MCLYLEEVDGIPRSVNTFLTKTQLLLKFSENEPSCLFRAEQKYVVDVTEQGNLLRFDEARIAV